MKVIHLAHGSVSPRVPLAATGLNELISRAHNPRNLESNRGIWVLTAVSNRGIRLFYPPDFPRYLTSFIRTTFSQKRTSNRPCCLPRRGKLSDCRKVCWKIIFY